MNRIITFKDLYGTASNSTIILVTRSGDTFEDGTFSTILSNAYQTVNLYAGQPGKWLNIDGGSGGSSAGLTTVSNLLNSVSTNVTSVSTNVATVSNQLNSVSTNVTNVSTNLATVSNTGRFAYVSTNTVSTNLLMAGYVSSPQGYISSLVVDALSFSLSNSFISMGDIITTSVSTIQTFTSTLTTNNLRVGTVSTLSYIAFSGLQQGYNQTVIAEQATASGIQELLIFRGSTNTDRIRMQTTGPIVFEPGVSARVFPATGSNATPAMIITTGSNVGIGIAAPTVSLDVAGAGRFTAVSTQTISTNQLNSSNICNVGWFSNAGNLSNGGSAYFFSNGVSAASPSTTNVFPYATFKINSASTNTLSPVVPLLLMTGGYGGSIAGGLTQSVGPILSLGTVDGGLPSTIEGYRLTGSNSAFYGSVDMRSNTFSNVGASYFANTVNMNCNIIANVKTMTFNTAAGTAQIDGVYPNQLNIQAANVYVLGNLSFYGTGYYFDFATNNIINANITRTTTLSTNTISTNTLTLSNINGTGDLPITAANGCNVNLTALYINLIANNVQFSSNFAMNTGTTAATYNLTAANFTRTVSLSTNTISTNTLTVGGSALSARLGIQSNATTLTSPASVIITIPNMSYFFADYTNLTNYITISNYGAQNGDYINVINTGNSGTPATFQILDGSTGVSTNIRYIYPGHAGVVAYSGGQWWPM